MSLLLYTKTNKQTQNHTNPLKHKPVIQSDVIIAVYKHKQTNTQTRTSTQTRFTNQSFRSGDLAEALAYYTRSLLLSPTVAAYNNRALMYIKLGEPESALADCAKVLELDSGNSKG